MEELIKHLEEQGIAYNNVDGNFFNIPELGECMFTDIESKQSVFRQVKFGDDVSTHINMFETRGELLADGIRYVFFYFGEEWNYIDLEDEKIEFYPAYNIGRHVGCKFHQDYINLGARTGMEILNGSGVPERWVRRAKFLGHKYIGLCDFNTMGGTLELQKACDKVGGVSPVFGYSTVFDVPYIDGGVNIKLYVNSQDGLHSLFRIQKSVMIDRSDGKIALDELLKYSKGLSIVIGKQHADFLNTSAHTIKTFKEHFQYVYFQIDFNEYLANRIDINVLKSAKYYFRQVYKTDNHVDPILLADCFYINKHEYKNKTLLNMISSNASYDQSKQQWYKTIDEHFDQMKPLFKDHSELDELLSISALNSIKLAESCSARYVTDVNYMPEYEMLPEEKEKYGNPIDMFDSLLEDGFKRLVPEGMEDKYREQLEKEKYVIKSTNNVDYMLTQYDMVSWARRNDILVGTGRGSAGGSLVLYLLGITDVDPIKYHLLFERFLVPERAGLYEATVTKIDDKNIDDAIEVVEVEFDDGRKITLDVDSQLAIEDSDRAVYADELKVGDDVIFDNIHQLIDIK